MLKKSLLFVLLIALSISCICVVIPQADAVTYSDYDWEMLIENYRASFCGKDEVDWSDPEIQKIVGVKNSSGISTSGISYNGGRYWLDLGVTAVILTEFLAVRIFLSLFPAIPCGNNWSICVIWPMHMAHREPAILTKIKMESCRLWNCTKMKNYAMPSSTVWKSL